MKKMRYILTILLFILSFGFVEAPNYKSTIPVYDSKPTAERIQNKIEELKEQGLWNDKFIKRLNSNK
jgi:hypothetical protein